MRNEQFQSRSISEQVAQYLRDQIQSGLLHGDMPGVHALAKECGIHHTTAAEAMGQLEAEGYIKSQGAGRKRKILVPEDSGGLGLKIGILLYEPEDIGTEYVNELRHQLNQAGHDSVVAKKTLLEIRFDPKRLKSLVNAAEANAWLVLAGSKEVLEWFAEQELPTFALFGNHQVPGVAHTGPVKSPLVHEIVQRLVKLNHQRIVLLVAEQLRKDQPIRTVQAFLDELEAQGLPPSSYHLPDWDHEPGSLQACLSSLFQITPPTAILVDDPIFMPAVFQFLNQHQLTVPGDVSLICLDGDRSFKWMEPKLFRLEADISASIRHALMWLNRVAKGKVVPRKYNSKVKLIEGGTVGPARD